MGEIAEEPGNGLPAQFRGHQNIVSSISWCVHVHMDANLCRGARCLGTHPRNGPERSLAVRDGGVVACGVDVDGEEGTPTQTLRHSFAAARGDSYPFTKRKTLHNNTCFPLPPSTRHSIRERNLAGEPPRLQTLGCYVT
jgi:hypothetical protein